MQTGRNLLFQSEEAGKGEGLGWEISFPQEETGNEKAYVPNPFPNWKSQQNYKVRENTSVSYSNRPEDLIEAIIRVPLLHINNIKKMVDIANFFC